MRPSFDTNKQKTNRHVNPAETHVHTNRHRHARRVHFHTLMHTQRHAHRHTPFWRRHDDFLPPVSSLSHKHTHNLSLSVSRFGLEMQRGKTCVPLNRQAQPLPTIGDDAAVLTLPALSVFGHACVNPTFLLLLSSLSVFFFFLLLVRKETTRACTFSCPHSRVTLHTHSPASICASSHPETRLNRMSPTREKKSKEADLVGLLRDRAQDPSTAVHPCLVQGQQAPVQAMDACMMRLLPPCFVNARRRQWEERQGLACVAWNSCCIKVDQTSLH